MDKLRAIEVIVEVADTGSLAGAGRALGISPPTVTRVLNDFEIELGVLLFHRNTRAVTLTEPGRSFLVSARRILQEYREASDSLRGAHRAPTGTLRVTASALFGRLYVLPLLHEYLDAYEDVKVEAVFLDRIVNVVEEGFDLAVRIGPLPDSSMMATRVGSVRRVVCGSPAYFEKHGVPRTPDDLKKHNVLSALSLTPAHEWKFDKGYLIKLPSRLSVSSMSGAIDSAKAGWGLTQALSYQIGPELDSGALQTVLGEYEPEPLPVHLMHAEGRAASAKVRSFVAMASNSLRANPYLNK